jgi:aspartyl-tRNA(Asn)/glutamyl-tRNA(Gln) amidotransferase subunit C
MSLNREQVMAIARLARLGIEESAIEDYARDLSRILELVAEMNRVDTDGVSPMAHPMDVAQRLRPDDVTETDQRDKFQAIAPDVEAGLYRVPKVIE